MAEKERFELSLRFTRTTPLAGEPLRPLGYFSMCLHAPEKKWRRERDSNPRCLSASLVFKTSAINHSAIPPRPATTALPEALIQYIKVFVFCQSPILNNHDSAHGMYDAVPPSFGNQDERHAFRLSIRRFHYGRKLKRAERRSFYSCLFINSPL